MDIKNEDEFVVYWQQNRKNFSTASSKLIRGFPFALLFTLPIMVSVIAVYFLSPDWYAKMKLQREGIFMTIFIALFIIVIFIAYFRMHLKWEQNEEAYQKFLRKRAAKAAN